MVHKHYDEETGISTKYHLSIEGVELNFKDSRCSRATISFYKQGTSGHGIERELLYSTRDCPKVLHWTPAESGILMDDNYIQIEYLDDGYMRREVLATEEEVVDIARQAVYDEWDEAHIEVTHTLSVGTSTVWFEVIRNRYYSSVPRLDIRFVVEFGNSEECTRFLHEDMRILEHLSAVDMCTGIAVIRDIMRDLLPIANDLLTAHKNALLRSLPYSQFVDDLPQLETQLIRHRGSNRGDDRPCYLTLHISFGDFFYILCANWSATTIPSTFSSHSTTFRSLNNLHLKFPSHASQHRNPNSSSQSNQDDLTITISAREISFTTGTDSASLGSGFTLSSEHRTVNVNHINAILGDAFLAPISGGTIGGRNNVNNSFSMRTDEGASMLNDLRSINDLANGSLANSPLTTGSTDLRSDQSMIGTKPARKTISTYARRFATAIRFRPPYTTERHNG
ncbi:hypothetical protein BDN71DRAFT_1451470 [Pleurotus eryngii]|uniref:Uncharacterized protein n=1 Tax=Pleurotus eryngii TaxID=5323 RepID=A0A9P5ZTR2_PLEER|nr:hypothetical protein BDN71DRAFT_1451470 [Pleurotus eryngii]